MALRRPAPTDGGAHPGQGTRSVPLRGSRFLRYLLLGLDAAALSTAWVVAIVLVPMRTDSLVVPAAVTATAVIGGLTLFSVLGLYRGRVCSLRTVEYTRLARGCVLVALLVVAFSAVIGSIVPPRTLALATSLAFVLAAVARSGYRTWLTASRRSGRYLRAVLLVGAGDEAAEIVALLSEQPELGYRPVGVVGDPRAARANGLHDLWLGELEAAPAVLSETGAPGAIICASDLCSVDLNQIASELLRAGTHLQLSSGLHGVDVARLRPSPLAHEPLFYVEPVKLASWQLAVKRAIDIVLSSAVLIVAAPVLVLVALGIKLGDRGPVLFKQQRVGRGGELFALYKLRTMRVGAEAETAGLLKLNRREGPLLKVPQDPRVTRIGRILRATSIDELPQLWNVLNGTMSLVGPRPALPNEVANFDIELRTRELVRPGITGLWQVEGRDNPSFAAYRRCDLFYLRNWSVMLDLMILLNTVESVAARAFRGLRHLDEDIPIVPPEVSDPTGGLEARTGAARVGAAR